MLWKPKGDLDILDSGHEFLLFRFDLEEDLEVVLSKGSWIIQDHYLTVRKWHLEFVSFLAIVESTLAWVRFPSLSIVYYDVSALRTLARCIGTPIKIDSNTALATLGKFAKVCMDIDLTKPLIGQFMLDGKWQKVKYKFLHVLCYHCGCYSHTSKSCAIKIQKLKETIAKQMGLSFFPA